MRVLGILVSTCDELRGQLCDAFGCSPNSAMPSDGTCEAPQTQIFITLRLTMVDLQAARVEILPCQELRMSLVFLPPPPLLASHAWNKFSKAPEQGYRHVIPRMEKHMEKIMESNMKTEVICGLSGFRGIQNSC